MYDTSKLNGKKKENVWHQQQQGFDHDGWILLFGERKKWGLSSLYSEIIIWSIPESHTEYITNCYIECEQLKDVWYENGKKTLCENLNIIYGHSFHSIQIKSIIPFNEIYYNLSILQQKKMNIDYGKPSIEDGCTFSFIIRNIHLLNIFTLMAINID